MALHYVLAGSVIYVASIVMFRLQTREATLDVNMMAYIRAYVFMCLVAYFIPYLLKFIVVVACGLAVSAYFQLVRGPKFKDVDLTGRVCIVTGANTGIGLETSKELVRMGARVILGT